LRPQNEGIGKIERINEKPPESNIFQYADNKCLVRIYYLNLNMIEQELKDVHGILSEINGLLERDGSISIRPSVCPSVISVGLSSRVSLTNSRSDRRSRRANYHI